MADPWDVVIVIDGQTATPLGRLGSLLITDELNDAPNSANLTTQATPTRRPSAAFAPFAFDAGAFNTAPAAWKAIVAHAGSQIAVYLGTVDPASLLFGGEVVVLDQFYEADRPEHVAYHLSCTDFTRRGNRKQVLKSYGQQSATAIVQDIVATATDLTGAHIAAGLPTVDGGIVFTWEDVSRALSRTAEKVGASWYWDYLGDCHFFLTEADAAPAPIVPGGAPFAEFRIQSDITQVRTRVYVEGDGSTLLYDWPSGSGTGAILPIADATVFDPAGGLAVTGTSKFTYGTVQPGGGKANTVGDQPATPAPAPAPNPPTAPVANKAAGAGNLRGGPYRYGVTFELSDGSRSAMSPASNAITFTPAPAPSVTTAALVRAPGPIAVGVASIYAQSFIDAAGGETTATTGGPSVTGRIVDPPAAPGRTASSGGTIEDGYYFYGVSYLTRNGETTAGSNGPPNAVYIDFGACNVGAPVSTDARVVGRRIYRSSKSPDTSAIVGPWRVVVDIPNNTATEYKDTQADANLPPAPGGILPPFNSATDTGEQATVTLQVSPDNRVTRRRLYRKDGPGEYRFIAEIPNNTATSYVDDGATQPSGVLAPTVNTVNSGQATVTAIQVGPAATVRRRLFRTASGGSQYREVAAIDDNVTTSYADNDADANLGGAPLPSQGGPSQSAPPIPPTPIGSATIRVSSLAPFPDYGWILVAGQAIYYGAHQTTDGKFYLANILPTGTGAIVAAIPNDAVVTAAPALVNCSALPATVAGDPVQLLVQVDDTAAQATIAALEGGDGIIEEYIQDRRLSEAGARARGLASLELFKAVEIKISYLTWDPLTRSGKTVHVDLPAPTNLTGDFLIQSVTIDQIDEFSAGPEARLYPRRRVVASSTRFTFDNVLQRLLMEET